MKNIIYGHIVAVAAWFLLFGALPSMAQEGPGPGGPEWEGQEEMRAFRHHRGDQGKWKEMWKEAEASLGLREDQRVQMDALRAASRVSQEALRAQLKDKREALRQELDAENPDRAKAEAVVKEIGALQQQIAMDRVAQVFAVRAVLTSEQNQKLRAFHEKKRTEFKQKRRRSRDE